MQVIKPGDVYVYRGDGQEFSFMRNRRLQSFHPTYDTRFLVIGVHENRLVTVMWDDGQTGQVSDHFLTMRCREL